MLYWCDQCLPDENDSAASMTALTKLIAVEARVATPRSIATVLVHATTHRSVTTRSGGCVWPSSIHSPTGRYSEAEPVDTLLSRRASG